MLRPGWTDLGVRAVALAFGALALAGCAATGGGRGDVAAVAGEPGLPAPEVQARYAGLVAGLQAGEAGASAGMEAFSAEHPELAGPLVNLGMARARAGDEAAARDYLERATRVCARCGSAWNELGVLARRQGRFADAEQAYLRAIELEAGFAPAYFNLGVLYELYLPRPELALQNYQRYLELADPADADVEKWVADLRRRVGDTPKAARTEPAT